MKREEKQEIIRNYLGKEIEREEDFAFGMDEKSCLYVKVGSIKMTVAQAIELNKILLYHPVLSSIIVSARNFIKTYC